MALVDTTAARSCMRTRHSSTWSGNGDEPTDRQQSRPTDRREDLGRNPLAARRTAVATGCPHPFRARLRSSRRTQGLGVDLCAHAARSVRRGALRGAAGARPDRATPRAARARDQRVALPRHHREHRRSHAGHRPRTAASATRTRRPTKCSAPPPTSLIGAKPLPFIHTVDRNEFGRALARTNTRPRETFRLTDIRLQDRPTSILDVQFTGLGDAPGISGTVVTARITTDQVKAEKQLRLSESKFSTIFHSSPDAMLITAQLRQHDRRLQHRFHAPARLHARRRHRLAGTRR